MGWRTCVDWQTKRPLATRATAHLSVILIALAAVVFGGLVISEPRVVRSGASDARGGVGQVVLSERSVDDVDDGVLINAVSPVAVVTGTDAIERSPVPHTEIPDRPRDGVITHKVQEGDTVYGIAMQYGISAETVVWSNREALQDAPWLISRGLELYILPVSGVYHTVREGETVADIASEYDVETAALYNEWNDLEEGDNLEVGQMVVVPGGTGESIEWEPPPRYPAPGPSGLSYGFCSGASVQGPGANGWFILPTGSRRVSGWYFHDPRNPTHIGLDYGCSLGDPIYAADNGVVTISGWNGGYGIMAEVNHGNGFVTRYAHFNSIAVGCGESVRQGQILGYCGTTGYSSGTHLHYEIRYRGVPQDPMAYQPQ